MKQIEKLAKDFSKTPITIRGPFTVDSGILNLIINEREIAYQAGFLKAREMASKIPKDIPSPKELTEQLILELSYVLLDMSQRTDDWYWFGQFSAAFDEAGVSMHHFMTEHKVVPFER